MEAEAEALAHFQMLADPGMRFLPRQHHPMHRPALGGTAADQTPDPVLGHEIQGPRDAALDRLPALDRQAQRPGYDRQLLEAPPAAMCNASRGAKTTRC